MSIKFTKLGSILLITAVSSFFGLQAQAQSRPQEQEQVQNLSTVEVFEKAFFRHSGNAFQNGTIISNMNTILGFNLFPENQINKDAKLVNMLYRDVLQTQAESAVPIRSRNLANPYNTSLKENPDYIGY